MCTHTHTHTHKYICMCVCVCVYSTHTHTHTHTHKYIHAYIHIYTICCFLVQSGMATPPLFSSSLSSLSLPRLCQHSLNVLLALSLCSRALSPSLSHSPPPIIQPPTNSPLSYASSHHPGPVGRTADLGWWRAAVPVDPGWLGRETKEMELCGSGTSRVSEWREVPSAPRLSRAVSFGHLPVSE